jgi:hypothetical protein
LIGWKAIRKVTDDISEDTLRRWTKEEGFPLVFIGRTPFTTEDSIRRWIEAKIQQGMTETRVKRFVKQNIAANEG